MKGPTTLIAISCFASLGLCGGDVFNARTYKPPYFPNKCGYSRGEIPSDMLFAALGPQLWNNGAYCGVHFILRCTAGLRTGKCTGTNVRVKVIEGRLGPRAPAFSLSETAAAKLYTGGGARIEWGETK
uniref:Plant natriuretic peptide-like 11 n=1 Tax=Venturia pyrina TaxID=415593 RepID=A0A513ZSA8_9PEZI|nr:plant natriuretic peptide-like 11 [Venturia pyrina]